jgi:hypothetical protein
MQDSCTTKSEFKYMAHHGVFQNLSAGELTDFSNLNCIWESGCLGPPDANIGYISLKDVTPI